MHEMEEIRFANLSFKKSILASGGHLKNAFCLARRHSIFLSRMIGDLDNLGALKKFEKEMLRLKTKLGITPKIIAHDLHPEYLSTKYALGYPGNVKRIGIQHHHAHIASCLVDNIEEYDPKESVIGVAFDGTGFGLDQTLWGGEFLVANFRNYRRVAHLKSIALPGGEIAIKDNSRVAFSVLYNIFNSRAWNLKIGWLKQKKYRILAKMLDNDINSPLSSSAGRLFDAVSAILGVCLENTYQAQAAIELEELASKVKKHGLKPYRFKITKENGAYILNYDMMIKNILSEMNAGINKETVAYKFHFSLAKAILDTCKILRRITRISKVALSGGVFQNKILSGLAVDLLKQCNFTVLTHKKLTPSDSSICVGQAVIASYS